MSVDRFDMEEVDGTLGQIATAPNWTMSSLPIAKPKIGIVIYTSADLGEAGGIHIQASGPGFADILLPPPAID